LKAAQQKIAEGILFIDQYQLTMAQLYYRMGLQEIMVQFDHYFRENPNYGLHQAGYCVNAGLEWLLDWMQQSYFTLEHIELLRGQTGRNGQRIFGDDFLEWLKANGNFEGISIQAVAEGRNPAALSLWCKGSAMTNLETALLDHLDTRF
jgi:nicotinate phosphoribosyltransferase